MIKFAIGAGLGLVVGGVVATIMTRRKAEAVTRAQFGAPLNWGYVALPAPPVNVVPPQDPAAPSPQSN